MKNKWLIALVWLLGMAGAISAQEGTGKYITDYQIDSLKLKELRLDIDNLFFFKNNEYSSSVMKG